MQDGNDAEDQLRGDTPTLSRRLASMNVKRSIVELMNITLTWTDSVESCRSILETIQLQSHNSFLIGVDGLYLQIKMRTGSYGQKPR